MYLPRSEVSVSNLISSVFIAIFLMGCAVVPREVEFSPAGETKGGRGSGSGAEAEVNSDPGSDPVSGPVLRLPPGLTVRVKTADEEDLPDARVRVAGIVGITDARGLFHSAAVSPGEHTIHVERRGYVETFQPARVRAGVGTFKTLYVFPAKTRRFKDISAGASIIEKDIEFIVPPNTFVDAAGRSATEALIEYGRLDARGPGLRAMPGDFMGRDRSGRAVQLESFGAASLRVIHPRTREEFQIRPGARVILRLPFQGDRGQFSGSVPVWSFNESEGLWIEEQAGRLLSRPDGIWVEARPPHLSWWNIDAPIEDRSAVWVRSFVSEKKEFLFTPELAARGLDYNGTSGGSGQVDTGRPGRCLEVKADSRFELQASFYDGRDFFEYRGKHEARAGGTSCREELDVEKALVIPSLELRRIPAACVRGRVQLEGEPGPFSVRVQTTTARGDAGQVSRLLAYSDANGEFCVDGVPADRGAFLVFEGNPERSLEDCDRARRASIPLRVAPEHKGGGSCARNRAACYDAGLIRGRLLNRSCDSMKIPEGR